MLGKRNKYTCFVYWCCNVCTEEACEEAKESPLDLARVARVIKLMLNLMLKLRYSKIEFFRSYKIRNKTS
jgi:hypothetical protein